MLIKYIKRFLIILFLIPCFAILAVFILPPFFHNMDLKSFAKQLQYIDMPANTQIIESKAVCGKLYGINGGHMDFLAAVLIKSDKSLYELEEHFGNMVFQPALTESKKYANDKPTIEIIEMVDSKLNYTYLEHDTIVFKSINTVKNFANYYAIVLFDGGYHEGFDLRAH